MRHLKKRVFIALMAPKAKSLARNNKTTNDIGPMKKAQGNKARSSTRGYQSVIKMKNYIVATVVAGGLIAAPFSASAQRFVSELDVGAYTGTFAGSAPIRNPDLHPTVLLKVGSWRQLQADDAHRRASLQPYAITNVRLENTSSYAVKDAGIACASTDNFSIPGVIRAHGFVVLGSLEVVLPNSGGTDGVCKVVSFTPFHPGSPRNAEKEQSQNLSITTTTRSFYIPRFGSRM